MLGDVLPLTWTAFANNCSIFILYLPLSRLKISLSTLKTLETYHVDSILFRHIWTWKIIAIFRKKKIIFLRRTKRETKIKYVESWPKIRISNLFQSLRIKKKTVKKRFYCELIFRSRRVQNCYELERRPREFLPNISIYYRWRWSWQL